MILSIVVVIGFIIIIAYSIDSTMKQWKMVDYSAQVIMERQLAKENKKDGGKFNPLPLSEAEKEETENDMEEQDFLDEVI